jgi:hypothetical protein
MTARASGGTLAPVGRTQTNRLQQVAQPRAPQGPSQCEESHQRGLTGIVGVDSRKRLAVSTHEWADTSIPSLLDMTNNRVEPFAHLQIGKYEGPMCRAFDGRRYPSRCSDAPT